MDFKILALIQNTVCKTDPHLAPIMTSTTNFNRIMGGGCSEIVPEGLRGLMIDDFINIKGT